MASISESNNNINNYKDMKDKVNAMIIYFEKYDDIKDKLLLKIDQNYEIDYDNPIIYNRIKELSVDVNKTSNYLKYTILPAIDSAIQSENENIEAIQQREAEEKARAEAAAAAAAAAAQAQAQAEAQAAAAAAAAAAAQAAAQAQSQQAQQSSKPSGPVQKPGRRRCPKCGNLMNGSICLFCDGMVV